MIYVEYTEKGLAVSDFKYEMWLEHLKNCIKIAKAGYDTKFEVSTSIPISAVRLAICRGEIDHSRISFVFKNKIFHADKNGRIDNWPKGFADIEGDLAFNILSCQIKKHTRRENAVKLAGTND